MISLVSVLVPFNESLNFSIIVCRIFIQKTKLQFSREKKKDKRRMKKSTSATGFEPAREITMGFKSISLTTRTH